MNNIIKVMRKENVKLFEEHCEKMDLISRMDEKKRLLIDFMNYVQTKQAIHFIDKEELSNEFLKTKP